MARCRGGFRSRCPPDPDLAAGRGRFRYPDAHVFPALLPLVCSLLLTPQQAQPEPFIGIGIWYGGGQAQPPATGAADLETFRSELAVIRRAGFNSITTWVNWREAEPQRGTYTFAGIERLIAAAAQNDLKVEVRVFTEPVPAWASALPADRDRFISYATKRLRLGVQVRSVEPADGDNGLAKAIRVGRNAERQLRRGWISGPRWRAAHRR